MGIPRFFRLISEQFPDTIQNISFKRGFTGTIIDNLYLDANGIIHECSREIYFPKKPPKIKRTPLQLEFQVFNSIADYMDQLLKFARPQGLFYIAIDGSAPLAKICQQRQRRYRTAKERSDSEMEIFDSTAITPGTYFMYKLSKFLSFYIRQKITEDPVWRQINVIFSDSSVAGEGEHKIIQYIRSLKDGSKLSHCMYGLDADLFMLGLSTHCPKFYLLREDQFNTVWGDVLFFQVDLGLLHKQIFDYWGSLGGDEESLVNDFIFICFLVGNDFLHALPSCHDLVESINFLMDLRREVLNSSYITQKNSTFDLNNLTILLAQLSTTETSAISSQFYDQTSPNLTLNNSLIDPLHPDQGIDLEKYRKLYYKKAGIDHKNKSQIYRFCRGYLQGLEWVNYYYHNRPKNWRWFFPYHYSPLVTDLVDYLQNPSKNARLTRISNKASEPISPFLQLLAVVPPRSKHLLPRSLQTLFDSPELSEYYPRDFSEDLEGKIRDWEAIALLPFIDIDKLSGAYKEAIKDSKTFERNRFGDTFRIRYSSSKRCDYESIYGRIKDAPISIKIEKI